MPPVLTFAFYWYLARDIIYEDSWRTGTTTYIGYDDVSTAYSLLRLTCLNVLKMRPERYCLSARITREPTCDVLITFI